MDEDNTHISEGGKTTTYILLLLPALCREAGNIKGNTRTHKQPGFNPHRQMCSIFWENQLK